MIIPNKFIKLDYNPTTDVLFIEWPNMHEYSLPEVKYIIDEIVETVKHYDIKRILTDSRESAITVDKAAYSSMINQLALDLSKTRLLKFARLATPDPNREQIARDAAALVVGEIQYKSFESTEEAIEWLTA